MKNEIDKLKFDLDELEEIISKNNIEHLKLRTKIDKINQIINLTKQEHKNQIQSLLGKIKLYNSEFNSLEKLIKEQNKNSDKEINQG